jgi:hypothetical protein
MECVFDENEVEYHSCERPMCNHTECEKHEEHVNKDKTTCAYYGNGKICTSVKGCKISSCNQHVDYYTNAASKTAEYMKRYVGKRVYACKDGRYSHPGTLLKVFVKGKVVAYKVKETNGSIGTFSDVRITMFQD